MLANVINRLTTGVVGAFTSCDTLDVARAIDDGECWSCDYPVLVGGAPYRHLQQCIKFVWEWLALRRSDPDPRPTVLYQDEASHFLMQDFDQLTQSTARQSMLIRVTAIQDFQLGYAALGGGDRGKQQFLSIVNNCGLWVNHAQADVETATLICDRIGKSPQTLYGGSVGLGAPLSLIDDWLGQAQPAQVSFSQHTDWTYRPEWMNSRLARGGPKAGWKCGCLALTTGAPLSGGRVWLETAIPQVR